MERFNTFKNLDDLKEYLGEMEHYETIILEDPSYITAVIGITDDERLVYDYEKMIKYLMDTDGMEYEDAMEFIDYNTIRAIPYFGEFRPLVIHTFEECYMAEKPSETPFADMVANFCEKNNFKFSDEPALIEAFASYCYGLGLKKGYEGYDVEACGRRGACGGFPEEADRLAREFRENMPPPYDYNDIETAYKFGWKKGKETE